MSLNFPPDDYQTVGSTIWGSADDIDEETTTNKTGPRSLKFLDNGAPGYNPELESVQYIPVQLSTDYIGETEVQASSTTGTNHVWAIIDWYDKNKALISSSNIRAAAAVSLANTWEISRTVVSAPSTAAYAKQRFGKTGAAFSAIFDRFTFFTAVPGWRIYNSSTWSHTSTGNFLTYPYNSTSELIGCTVSSGVITIVHDGLYSVGGTVYAPTLGNTYEVRGRITINKSGSPVYVANSATTINSTGGSRSYFAPMNDIYRLSAGDTLEVEVYQDTGGSYSFGGGVGVPFYGAMVESL